MNRSRVAAVVPVDPGGSSLAVLRSLSRRGVHTIGVGTNDRRPGFASRHCHESVVVPDPSEELEEYASALLRVARREDVRTVVPLSESDAYVLSRDRDVFARHVGTPWPEHAVVSKAQDRARLFELATDVDIHVPKTALAGSYDAYDDRCVVKPRYSLYVDSDRAQRQTPTVYEAGGAPDVDALVDDYGHEPLVQSYVPNGGEFGYFALYDHGTPVSEFQHRRVRSYTYAGGASVYRRSYHDPALAAAGRHLLDALDWHGPAMVEFRRDPRDGTYRLLEVNPRFWGSLPLASVAGVDFPGEYWRLAIASATEDRGHHESLQEATDGGTNVQVADDVGSPPAYDVGVGCHRLLGEVNYLASIHRDTYVQVDRPSLVRQTAAVASSLVRDPHFDILSLSDPRPFLANLADDWKRFRTRDR